MLHGLCGLPDAKNACALLGLWLTIALACWLPLALLTPGLDLPLVGWAAVALMLVLALLLHLGEAVLLVAGLHHLVLPVLLASALHDCLLGWCSS